MKCRCGTTLEVKPPARWVGNTELGQPVIRVRCASGHDTDFQLETMKPYTAERSESFPPQRGEYFAAEGSPQFSCPVCRCMFGIGGGVHAIEPDGKSHAECGLPAGLRIPFTRYARRLEANERHGQMTRAACNYYRDRDGFCHLTNRCWAGKPCPKTQLQADRAREQIIDEIRRRHPLSRVVTNS